jgi:hypothetical protein
MIEGGVHTGGVLCGFRHGGQDFSFAAEVRHLDFAAGIILRPLARVNPRGEGTSAAGRIFQAPTPPTSKPPG